MENEFNPIKKEKFPVGKWIILYEYPGARTFSGKLEGVIEGKYILNPFQIVDYTGGKPQYKIVNQTSEINISTIGMKEITTEENLKGYCKYQNGCIKDGEKAKKQNNKPKAQ